MKVKTAYTEFAPAERSLKSEIKHQNRVFSMLPRLQEFIDYIPDIVVVLNKNRQIVLANKAIAPILGPKRMNVSYGLRPGELLGCTHAFENKAGCGTSKFCGTCNAVKAILSALRGQEDIQECRITQKDSNNALDLRVWSSPVTLDDEQFDFFVASDISIEKRKGVLERTFFHDIMNIAGNIHGLSTVLKDTSPSEADEVREIIYELSNQLIDEINAQKELIAAENGDLSIHPSPINSKALLEETLDSYRRQEVAEKRKIIINRNSQQITFTSDKTLLRRVLYNMVKNALEASNTGETVKLWCKKKREIKSSFTFTTQVLYLMRFNYRFSSVHFQQKRQIEG